MDDEARGELRLRYPYVPRPMPFNDGDGTYADPEAHIENQQMVEFNHPLGEVVTSLIDAGLRIDFLHEFPFGGWRALPDMTRSDDGYYHLPDDSPVPLLFSVKATKPA